MTLVFLALAALLTSTISALIGMGGGVLLLAIMTLVLPYQALIPIHGIVQFVSNSSRAFFLRKNINWIFLSMFLLGTPIGTLLAYYILNSIKDSSVYYLLLALLILYSVFKPKRLPAIILTSRGWFVLGVLASLLSPLLGATGPLLAVFYVRNDLSKEQIIATKASQQMFLHLLKIPLFLSLDFNYIEYSQIISIMVIAVLIGTFGGVKILSKLNEKVFRLIFKTVLVISALRLLYKFFEA